MNYFTMKIVVLKFGGTSVGTIEKIKKVAQIIGSYRKKKYKVIVVSSAMSGVTNELIRKSMLLAKILVMQNMICYYQLVNRLHVH